jgi:hypothetical protein
MLGERWQFPVRPHRQTQAAKYMLSRGRRIRRFPELHARQRAVQAQGEGVKHEAML